ncbi:hypothetical protein IFM89_039684 [Coptis chinensis]|uniref:Cytochrome c oxidase subunit 3 n=1 Tax=Coptis chinensis TaxID=261450 RepID=A0A835GT15_9MAGN|nr:hypothetical protein IFM89_039684 [Coptis chinensis]
MFLFALFRASSHSSLAPTVEIGGIWPPKGIGVLDPREIPFLNTPIPPFIRSCRNLGSSCYTRGEGKTSSLHFSSYCFTGSIVLVYSDSVGAQKLVPTSEPIRVPDLAAEPAAKAEFLVPFPSCSSRTNASGSHRATDAADTIDGAYGTSKGSAILATNATGLSTGSTLASYAATDTDSYAGGLTGLVTGAGYATTVTSVYGGCAPALNAFASADGTVRCLFAATSGWCSDAGHDSIKETAYSEAFTSATNFISRSPYGVQ